jgi:DNA polymerase epsilon subunit 1
MEERFEQIRVNDEVDAKLGFDRVQESGRREGWLVNMHAVRALQGSGNSS